MPHNIIGCSVDSCLLLRGSDSTKMLSVAAGCPDSSDEPASVGLETVTLRAGCLKGKCCKVWVLRKEKFCFNHFYLSFTRGSMCPDFYVSYICKLFFESETNVCR